MYFKIRVFKLPLRPKNPLMKKLILSILFGIPLMGLSQVSLNQTDNFENFTTANWTKSSSVIPNQNVFSDGPNGVDDNFLRIQSDGGAGSGGQLLTFNNAQWAGNYVAAGITYISMDVRNSGSTLITLRLSFLNTAWTNDPRWSSINPIAVLPGQGWSTIVFPINAASMSRLGHTNSYNGDFNNIYEMRILHNDAPAWDGDPIAATLDIDNIQARNSNLEIVDLDLLKTNIYLVPNPSRDYIALSGISEETHYKIFDLSARMISSGIIQNQDKIDIQNFNRGVYFLKLGSGEICKFIKE